MRTALWIAMISSVGVSLGAPAQAEKFTIDDDTFYTVGVLAQPQLLLSENGSPDGGLGSDLFLRRGRIILTGQIDPHIGFILVTDQANYGRNGDFSTQFFIQDAVASYKVRPELQVSAGFMLLPFMRNDFTSAGALNTIDFRAGVVKFLPTGKAFRDMGIEVRGLLVQDRIYYRAGVFNGIPGKAANPMATPPVAEVNETDAPRLTGNVRYNILGKEDAYALPGIYFAKEPIVNVGVGIDWQHAAFVDTGGDTHYLAMNVDAFADIPIGEDMELVAHGAVIKYDGYAAGAARDEAFAFYAEAGFRFRVIEPVAAIEYFNGHRAGTKVTTTRLGVNYWISKHAYNVKAELAIPDAEGVDDNLVGTLQAQVQF